MTVSFVLRLVPGLPVGDIAGEVEAVASGERIAVRCIGDLTAFLERFLDGGPALVSPSGDTVVIDPAPKAAYAPPAHVPTRAEDLL